MRIILDKEESNETEIKKEKKQSIPTYVVTKNNGGASKAFGYFIMGLLGGVIGGFASYYIASGGQNIQGNTNSTVTNETITSYDFATVENPVVAISKQVGPSVVGVRVTYTAQTFFGTTEAKGEGSGIIYSKEGYIITNYHVVEEAIEGKNAKVSVILSTGDTLDATVVGGDELTDIAVIKVNKTGLPAAEFGDSDGIEVGELAVAIGNPLGLEFAGSVTVGYVSAVNRTMEEAGSTYNLIQTDAAINSGNSGGPLVSAKGKVIGINTAKISATGVEGMGFAIPINEVLPIVEELITNKKIARPYIGIGGAELTEAYAKRFNLVVGVYVQTVDIKSPAEKAGIKQGDVITEVEGTKVTTVSEINVIKNKKKIGEAVTLKIYRDGKYTDIKVVLGEAE